MRIEHTVAFRLRHPQGSEAESAFLRDAERILSGIPGVEGFTVRRQVSPKSDLRWQFSMSFAGSAEYAAYDAHPDHRGFVDQRWLTEVEEFQELDLQDVAP